MKKFIFIIFIIIISSCSNKLIDNNIKKTLYSFPIYGNHCGEFSPPQGSDLIAIDGVDESCKNFDFCQQKFGNDNLKCFNELWNEILILSPQNSSEILARKLIIAYLQNKGFK